VARFGEQQLEALDLEPEGGDLPDLVRECGVPFGKLRLGGLPRRALDTQHRVRRGEVVGQEVEAVHATDSSTWPPTCRPKAVHPSHRAAAQPAATGLQVCRGILQSIPSSK
jgi:hypothetical protein